MFSQISFSARLILLIGLMATVSLIDWRRNGAAAAKFREYGFILLTGVLGGAVGFCNDLLTSSISPDYFVLGKGLENGPNLRWEAGLLGAQAGFSAGVIGGAVCLFATYGKSPANRFAFLKLAGLLWLPVSAAIVGGLIAALCFSTFDPAHFSSQLSSLLDPLRIADFRHVWWIHTGLYAGLVLGLVALIIKAKQEPAGKREQ